MVNTTRWLLLALVLCGALTATRVLAEEDDEGIDLGVEDIDDISDDGDDDYVDVDEVRARLLVTKGTGDADIVQGSNVTFKVQVYNAGQSTAKTVEIVDSVAEGFELIEGTTSLKVATIHPGTSVDLTYVALAKEAGLIVLPPVSVKYTSDNEDDTVQKGSSLPKRVAVLSTVDKLYKSALKVGQYVTLGTVRTTEQWLNLGYVAGGLAAAAALVVTYKSLSDANKRWKYQRALKEVEKMQ